MQHASGLVRYVWLDHNAACVGTDCYLDAAGVDDELGLSGVQAASVLQRSIFELDIFGTHPDYQGFNAPGIIVLRLRDSTHEESASDPGTWAETNAPGRVAQRPG